MARKVPTVYLSRRNLLALLSKLDRKAAGEDTQCMIEKSDNVHPTHAQTMKTIDVIAVENDEYYAHRGAGRCHQSDEDYIFAHTALNEDEVKLIKTAQEQKRVDAYQLRLEEMRKTCVHDMLHDYSSNYVEYTKCSKCGITNGYQFRHR